MKSHSTQFISFHQSMNPVRNGSATFPRFTKRNYMFFPISRQLYYLVIKTPLYIVITQKDYMLQQLNCQFNIFIIKVK